MSDHQHIAASNDRSSLSKSSDGPAYYRPIHGTHGVKFAVGTSNEAAHSQASGHLNGTNPVDESTELANKQLDISPMEIPPRPMIPRSAGSIPIPHKHPGRQAPPIQPSRPRISNNVQTDFGMMHEVPGAYHMHAVTDLGGQDEQQGENAKHEGKWAKWCKFRCCVMM